MWYVLPVLGVRRVRHAAACCRDVLGFTLAPDGVFQPSADEPDGGYTFVR